MLKMDIFKLSLQSVFLGTCVSTKFMMAGLSDYEETFDEENRTWQVSRIKKRLLDLEKECISPGIQRIMNDPQNLPEHLKDSVRQFQTSHEKNIFGVHLNLLIATSSAIISSITCQGVGNSTMTEVKQWFQMMEKLQQVKSYWPMKELHAFGEVIQSFKNFEVNDEHSVKEYPFFSCMGLLIQVAYTVDHLTFDHTTNSTKNGISCDDYEKWENVSGEICKQVMFANVPFGLNTVLSYKLSQESTENENKDNARKTSKQKKPEKAIESGVESGVESDSESESSDLESESEPESESETETESKPGQKSEQESDSEIIFEPEPELDEPMFLWWMLPYTWLFKKLRDNNNNVQPHLIHKITFGVVICRMQEILLDYDNTEEIEVFDKLSAIYDEQHALLLRRMAIFINRDKSSKHEFEERKKAKKKANKEYKYSPRYGNRFGRDIFIMGRESQYHSSTKKKKQKIKKKKKSKKKTALSKTFDICESIWKKQKYPERS
jgi:hypothetical protein